MWISAHFITTKKMVCILIIIFKAKAEQVVLEIFYKR